MESKCTLLVRTFHQIQSGSHHSSRPSLISSRSFNIHCTITDSLFPPTDGNVFYRTAQLGFKTGSVPTPKKQVLRLMLTAPPQQLQQ